MYSTLFLPTGPATLCTARSSPVVSSSSVFPLSLPPFPPPSPLSFFGASLPPPSSPSCARVPPKLPLWLWHHRFHRHRHHEGSRKGRFLEAPATRQGGEQKCARGQFVDTANVSREVKIWWCLLQSTRRSSKGKRKKERKKLFWSEFPTGVEA